MSADKPRGVRLTLLPGPHLWCRCGGSTTKPLCDDGERCAAGGGPLEVVVEEATEMKMCVCGRTRFPPRCDGSHNQL